MPASEEETSCSPAAINRKGPAVCVSASARITGRLRPANVSSPRSAATGASAAAASTTRPQETTAGESSRTPILISR